MDETNSEKEVRIRPVIILPEGEMRPRDIKKLVDNGLCVVEAKNPENVRFADPPPLGYSVQERAAIQLFRVLVRNKSFNISRDQFASMYVDILMEGFVPAPVEKLRK